MKILLVNDDSYLADGIKVLARILRAEYPDWDINVLAPKKPQSAMSMALSMRKLNIGYKNLGEIDGVKWHYLDSTPACCVKFALSENCPLSDFVPDLVVSGINHGSNAACAANYSGTLGVVEEAAINGINGIAISIANEDLENVDFSAVKTYLPNILKELLAQIEKRKAQGLPAVFYNVNFPKIGADEIKGIKLAHQGLGRWIKEFVPSTAQVEEGEMSFRMSGEFEDGKNIENADHLLNQNGYISIVPCTIDKTDYNELERMRGENLTFAK